MINWVADDKLKSQTLSADTSDSRRFCLGTEHSNLEAVGACYHPAIPTAHV